MTTPDEAFAALAKLPAAEIYAVVRLSPTDPATGQTVDLWGTSAPSLQTEPDDEPANEPFRNLLLKGWNLERSTGEFGAVFGGSRTDRGGFVFSNHDASLDPWYDYDWDGAPYEVYMGGRLQADGSPYPWSLYKLVAAGVCESLDETSDGDAEVSLLGRSSGLDKRIVTRTFAGWGGALDLDPQDFLSSEGPTGAADLEELTLEAVMVLRAQPTNQTSVLRHGTDWGLHIDSDGTLGWIVDDVVHSSSARIPSLTAIGSPPWYRMFPAEEVGVDRRIYLAVVARDVGGGLRDVEFWVGVRGSVAELEDTIRVDAWENNSGSLVFNNYAGNAGLLRLVEVRLHDAALTGDKLRSRGDKPLPDPANVATLVEAWKFLDGTGSTPQGELDAIDLTLVGGEWTNTLEGDDPEAFPGSVAGQTYPVLLGYGFNLTPVVVDSQNRILQVSKTSLYDVSRVKHRGAILAPRESQFADGDSDIVVADDVLDLSGGELTGHRFVPGGTNPEFPGQRIEIAGSGTAADGIYRIAPGGIPADGKSIALVGENPDVAAGLPDGLLPPGTEIRTPSDAEQYVYDLPNGTIQLLQPFDGGITVDAVGMVGVESPGELLVSELFRILTGEAPDADDLDWDPPVGLYLAPGDATTRKDAMDKTARSAGASWIENRVTGYALRTRSLPGATPEFLAYGGIGADLDSIPDVLARILDIRPQASALPVREVLVSYARNYTEQDDVAQALSEAEKRRLREPDQLARRVNASVSADQPAADEPPRLETYLFDRANAERLLDIAAPFFAGRRRWWVVDVAGVAPLALDLGADGTLLHTRAGLRLAGGVAVTLEGLEESSSSDIVSLELMT